MLYYLQANGEHFLYYANEFLKLYTNKSYITNLIGLQTFTDIYHWYFVIPPIPLISFFTFFGKVSMQIVTVCLIFGIFCHKSSIFAIKLYFFVVLSQMDKQFTIRHKFSIVFNSKDFFGIHNTGFIESKKCLTMW